MTTDQMVQQLLALSWWKDSASAVAQMERDVDAYLASFPDPAGKACHRSELYKAFDKTAPDSERFNLMRSRMRDMIQER